MAFGCIQYYFLMKLIDLVTPHPIDSAFLILAHGGGWWWGTVYDLTLICAHPNGFSYAYLFR